MVMQRDRGGGGVVAPTSYSPCRSGCAGVSRCKRTLRGSGRWKNKPILTHLWRWWGVLVDERWRWAVERPSPSPLGYHRTAILTPFTKEISQKPAPCVRSPRPLLPGCSVSSPRLSLSLQPPRKHPATAPGPSAKNPRI